MSVQQLLINVIRVPAVGDLALGASVTVPHGLRSNGKDVAPTNIQPQQVTGFVVTAVTDTEITFRNDGSGPSSTFFRVERGLQVEVDAYAFPALNTYWQGFAVNSGGGGGGGGAIVGMVATPPLAVANAAGPNPNYSLNLGANFTVTAGNLDLSTLIGAPGTFGGADGDQSKVPVITVDSKGRLTGATEQSIQLGGLPAKAYVDAGDASTLAAAEAFAESLAFGLATKAPAHVATTVALPAYSVSLDKKVLTASVNGAFPQIDLQNVLVTERILVKNEVAAANNGIYVLTNAGSALTPWVLTRASDADSATELCGSLITVQTGTTNEGSVWIFADNPALFILGTTAVDWTPILVGGATAGTPGTIQLTGGLGGAGSSFTLPKLDVSPSSVTSGTLAADHGGTGQNSYTVGQILYADSGSTLAKLNVGAANTVLRSNGTTPAWGSVDLTTDVTGVLPYQNGGTGLSSSGLDSTKFLKSNGDGTWVLAVPPAADTSLQYVLHVATDGNDGTGDGSIAKPFASIQGAHDYAVTNTPALFPVLAPIEIRVAPGSYNFATTLTRLNTFVRGAGSRAEVNAGTKLLQQVVITPAAGGSKFNTQIAIDGCYITDSSGVEAVQISGSNPCGILITNCYITHSTAQVVFLCSSSVVKVWAYGNIFNAQYAGAYNFAGAVGFLAGDVRGSDNYILVPNATSGGGGLWVSGSAYGLFDRTIIELAPGATYWGLGVAGTYTGSAGTYKVTFVNGSIYGGGKGYADGGIGAGVVNVGTFKALISNTIFGTTSTAIDAGTEPVLYSNVSFLAGTSTVVTGAGLVAATEVHGAVRIPSLSSTNKFVKADANKQLSTADITASDIASGTLSVARGGTGISTTPAIGTVLYGDGTAYALLSPGTVGQVLTSQGVGAAPQWTTAAAGTVTSITFDAGTTNATGLTVSGNPSQTITSSGSFVLGGKLSVAFGGTNATSIGLNGAVAYSDGSKYAFTAAGTAGQILTSAGAGAPVWITTLPVANGGTNATTIGASGSVAYSTGTAYAFSNSGTEGYVLKHVSGVPTWSVNTATPAGTAGPGDLTGTYPNPVVFRINGTTISTTGGALTTGHVLRVTGAATADYGPVDLGNTSAVTGTLPKTNQQAQDFVAGDITGSTANATVTKVQGKLYDSAAPTTGTVPTWDGTKFVYAVPSGGGGGGGGSGGGLTYYFNSLTAGQAPITGLNASTKRMESTDQATGDTITSGALSGSYALVAAFVTNSSPSVPELSFIPAGLWSFNLWASAAAAGTNEVSIQAKLYKYDGTTPTLIATGSPVFLSSPTVTTLLDLQLVVPAGTTVAETDRIYVTFEAKTTTGTPTISLFFGGSYPSHVHTTLPAVSGSGFIKVVNDVVQPTAQQVSLSADVSGTLPSNKGGTGQASYTAGDMLYYVSGTSLTKLGIGTTGQYLTVSAGGVPVWTTLATNPGTVTNVSSANALLSVANGTTTPVLTINTGSTSSTVAIGNDARFNPAPSGAGKLVYDTGTAYAALAAGTSGYYLKSNGTAAPSWAQLNVSDLSGTLPTTNGGTGQSSYTAGDLVYYASGTAFSKLAISGTAGAVLTSNGTAPAWTTSLLVTGSAVTANKPLVLAATSQTLNAVSDTIVTTTSLIKLNPTADLLLSSTPTINTTSVTEGTELTLVNVGSFNVTLQDVSQLALSGIQLGGVTSRLIAPFTSITLIYTGGYWVERSIGGSGTVQSVTGSGVITATAGVNPVVSINGLSSGGTATGIPYFTGSGTTMASSVALTADRLIVGGVSGPTPLTSGTIGHLLVSAGTGAPPAFQQVNLGTSVGLTGILGLAKGGTNADTSSWTTGSIAVKGATAFSEVTAGASGTVLKGAGAGVAPLFAAVNLASDVGSSILPVANGGTNTATTQATKVFAGPISGGDAAPSFRVLASTDMPTGIPAANVTGIPYDIAGSVAGTPTPSTECFYFIAVRPCTVAANGGLIDHKGGVKIAPTGSNVSFDVFKTGVVPAVGTITVTTAGAVTFSIASPVSLAANEVLTIKAPAALNGLSDFYFTFVATLA